MHENESTYIPIGETHRLENPGPEALEIIEVQSGAYLGEGDIERFEDRYGRGWACATSFGWYDLVQLLNSIDR